MERKKISMKDFFRRQRAARRVYADAAAATPIDSRVLARMRSLLPLSANPGGLHKEARAARAELEGARSEIAQAIGAHSDEIYFTGSGTEANNLALVGVLGGVLKKRPAHAIALSIEHHSVLEPLEHLKRYGLVLSLLPVDSDGLLSLKNLHDTLRSDTALVSVQLVNSELGTIEPIREVVREVRRIRKERVKKENTLPLYVHTDAAQAPLYLPLNVEHLGVDLMTLDAQKILGPKGVGALYIRRGVAIEPLIRGGGQERGMRAGTENVPLAGAFAEALTLAQEDVSVRARRVAGLRDLLAGEIERLLPGVSINGGIEHRVANNLNLSIEGLDAETAVIAMDAWGVAISTRSACVAKDEALSHVLKAIGLSPKRAREALRITLLPEVTQSEIRTIARTLARAYERYGKKT
ncbi:MAG: cysteine desulfurase [Patescibacteria group bacterium]|nr:cysteine desulfurase [Patescibacteria group bacterium]